MTLFAFFRRGALPFRRICFIDSTLSAGQFASRYLFVDAGNFGVQVTLSCAFTGRTIGSRSAATGHRTAE